MDVVIDFFLHIPPGLINIRKYKKLSYIVYILYNKQPNNDNTGMNMKGDFLKNIHSRGN